MIARESSTRAMPRRGLATYSMFVCAVLLAHGCKSPEKIAGTRTTEPSQQLTIVSNTPKSVDKGSAVFTHETATATAYDGVLIKAKIDAAPLEVRVDSSRAEVFPRVPVTPAHRRTLADGLDEIVVDMQTLNPQGHSFDRIVVRTQGKADIAQVGLLQKVKEQSAPQAASRNIEPRLFAVDCFGPSHKISPLIYGIALNPRRDAREGHQWKLNATTRRWGGNPASRYNWELGSAWNTGADYFFKNVNYTGSSYSYATFMRDNLAHGVSAAITIPMLGWVAKDTHSVSFPLNHFGNQRAVDPDGDRAGDGYTRDGKPLTPRSPEYTSTRASPQFIGRWVEKIEKLQVDNKAKGVALYYLDNEPELWDSTHRDVHPGALTYDELLERTLLYADAVRSNSKDAVIAGPASWGYTGYLYSGADAAAGVERKPDRLAHGDMPLIAWYLDKLRQHEEKTGKTLLDVVDVHFYPAGRGVFGGNEATDPVTNALRIRSTRALWDPGYMDESWVKDTIRLVPRLKDWIAQYYPGRGISIGEWNFGAENHMSGALALAEALGRFGEQGVTAAYYWTYPPDRSPAFYAFSAFRNYDEQRGVFLNNSLATRAPQGASLFAARNDDGTKITAVLLNFSPNQTLDAQIDFGACGAVKERMTFTYAGGSDGFSRKEVMKQEQGAVRETLAPYSITVMSLEVAPRSRPR